MKNLHTMKDGVFMEILTIGELCDYSIKIECRIKDMYRVFSEMFRGHPDISDFWKRLEKDELQHIEILKDIKTKLSPDEKLSASGSGMYQEMTGIEKKLDEIQLQSVRTLDDAYETAHDVEFSEINSVFLFLISCSINTRDRNSFFSSIITEHQNSLLEFGKRTGGRGRRREIKASSVSNEKS